MSRRERHLRILASFGRQADWHRDSVVFRRGYAAFTDEAIEEIAQDTVRSYKRSQKANAENRRVMETAS